MPELSCGRYGRNTLSEIADRAARHLMERKGNLALCLSLDGRVTLETPRSALEDDVVGVYNKTPGQLALWRQIEGDLRATVAERNIAAELPRRRKVLGQRAA